MWFLTLVLRGLSICVLDDDEKRLLRSIADLFDVLENYLTIKDIMNQVD